MNDEFGAGANQPTPNQTTNTQIKPVLTSSIPSSGCSYDRQADGEGNSLLASVCESSKVGATRLGATAALLSLLQYIYNHLLIQGCREIWQYFIWKPPACFFSLLVYENYIWFKYFQWKFGVQIEVNCYYKNLKYYYQNLKH